MRIMVVSLVHTTLSNCVVRLKWINGTTRHGKYGPVLRGRSRHVDEG